MTVRVAGAVMGRPTNSLLSDRLERANLRIVVLSDEVTALHAERSSLASEIAALSRRVDLAIRADRPDVAMHVAGRLEALAASLNRRGAA